MTRRETLKSLSFLRRWNNYGLRLRNMARAKSTDTFTRRQYARLQWRKRPRIVMDYNPNNTRRRWIYD